MTLSSLSLSFLEIARHMARLFQRLAAAQPAAASRVRRPLSSSTAPDCRRRRFSRWRQRHTCILSSSIPCRLDVQRVSLAVAAQQAHQGGVGADAGRIGARGQPLPALLV